ncbi:MAG: hypothetical protein [Microviridae sp.]|nr:MAG: hypothetical protein [Microviridae sp.]
MEAKNTEKFNYYGNVSLTNKPNWKFNIIALIISTLICTIVACNVRKVIQIEIKPKQINYEQNKKNDSITRTKGRNRNLARK